MGILQGLQTIKKYDEAQEAARAARERKVTWFTIAANEKVEVVFLQELDESSLRYNQNNGLGFLAQEHSNPSKAEFYKRILCTRDEEHDFQCWGCEKNSLEWSKSTDDNKYNGGWGVKTHLYINVLVRPEGEEPYVAVLQRKRSEQTFVDELLELAAEDGFISNRTVILGRKGVGFKTKHTMTVKDEDAGINVEDYELFDLKSVIRDVPYAEQARALGAGAPVPGPVQGSTSEPEDEDDW